MSNSKKTTNEKYRSAINGQYITKEKAKKNPNTTVKETQKKKNKK